jgi:sRNA-binding regulator protein Hfq
MVADMHSSIESSHAEAFYFQKQIQLQTDMTFVLEDGEELHGVIEWYDKCVLKTRVGRTRVMIYKASVKYLYKTSDAHISRPVMK